MPSRVPRQPMGVAEPVGVDLAQRLRVAIGGERVGRRDRVIAEALLATGDGGRSRIDAQDRGDDGVEALGLRGVVGARAAAVAEAEIAAAGVDQAVVGRPGPGRRVELDRAHRVGQVLDDVRHPQQLAPGALEPVRRWRRRPPLRDHVVMGDVGRREPRRNEVGRLRIAGGTLAVHRVEEAVGRELGMEGEADEPALEPGVDRVREHRPDVGVDGRRGAVEPVEEPARVVHEPAPVGKIAHVADPGPAGRVGVLVRRPQAAGVGQPGEVGNPHRQAALLDRRHRWTGQLRGDHAGGGQGRHGDGDRQRPRPHHAFTICGISVP